MKNLRSGLGLILISLTFGVSVAAQVCVQPPNGMVSWWRGDPDVRDIMGSFSGALLGGATSAPNGKVGRTFALTPQGHIQVPDVPSHYPTGSFTIDAWVSTPRTVIARESIVSKYECGGKCPSRVANSAYDLYIEGGQIRAYVRDTDAGLPNSVNASMDLTITGASINDGKFHHVALVRNVQSNQLALYVDGALSASASLNAGSDGPLQNDDGENDLLLIGARKRAGNQFQLNIPANMEFLFTGNIDEVEYFNRALSAAEINGIFSAQRAGKCPLIATISVGASPQGIAVDPHSSVHRIYVAILNQQKVSVIDEDGYSFVGDVPVNQSQASYPYGVTVDPLTHRVYVANMTPHFISVLNGMGAPAWLNETSVGQYANTDLRSIAVDPQLKRVYVANSAILDILNQNSPPVGLSGLPIIAPPFSPSSFGAVAVNPQTHTIYHTYFANKVDVINASNNSLITSITVGSKPVAIAVNPSTKRVYVVNQASGTVSVINESNNQVIATIPVGANPFDVAVHLAMNRVYVINEASATVSVINGATNSIVATVALPTGSSPRHIAVNETRNRAYITDNRLNKVYVYDIGNP